MSKPSIFDRLTDTSLYTGTHKHRFDDNGNGRGLLGRDRVAKGHGHIAGHGTADLSQITRTNLNTSGAGYANSMRASYSGVPMTYTSSPGISPTGPAPRTSYSGSPAVLRTSNDGQGVLATLPSPTKPGTPSPRPSSVGRSAMRTSAGGSVISSARRSGGGSIFDKLTDPSQYTGAHKHRFDSYGNGAGKGGRTTANAYVSAMDNVRR